MTDLETMLRTTLHDRAEDVEPTPELWRSVQHKVARRRAMPLLVWTAAGVAAAVTAVAVVPGLVDRIDEGFVIDPAQSPTAPASPGEVAPGPVAGVGLTHYVAVVDGRLVLRSVTGDEQVLWEGEAAVRTLAVAPGSTPDDLTVAFVTATEGMRDLRVWDSQRTTQDAVDLGPEPGDGTVVPTPAWSPDGRTVALVAASDAGADLYVLDLAAVLGDGDGRTQRTSLGGLADPGQLRVQDWLSAGEDGSIWFTSLGELYRAPIERVDDGWDVGALERADGGGGYVVDIATGADGTQYRLLAGGSSSGDAEDAGLALEFDNERIPFRDLPTASPADAWMTAVDGGAFVGVGSDARMVHRDPEGDSPHAPLTGVSYAAWVPVAGAAGEVPKGAPTAGPTDAPRADGPLSASGVTPYVAVDEFGRVAVHTGNGGEREVIISEQQFADLGAGTPADVTVRPGSTADEVAGVLLLDGGDGRELAWFRAAAGATAIYRMDGATGFGTDGLEQRDAPTWSPDGRHIAWVEPSDEGGWTLRTVAMADNGPTHADAGFGIDVRAERLHLANWQWSEGDDGADTAEGTVHLVDDAGRTYVLPIERQGDGALAVQSLFESVASDGPAGTILDLGFRGEDVIALVRTADGLVLRQPGSDVALTPPLPSEVDVRDLDLDVLADVAVVTDRASGWAVVVDRGGGAASLEVDAATTHAFDPVR